MPRKSGQKPPAYLLHKPSGRARVRIDGKDHYLGEYNSPESHDAYARLIAEWSASHPTLEQRETLPALDNLTVAELLVKYLAFAEGYYVNPDGTPSKELVCMKDAMRPLRKLYALTPVREFGPKSLKAVREYLISERYARTHINRTINRIRRIFKWGVAEELVAPAVLQALKTVDGLRKGRTEAKESEPVKPVPMADVEIVLPIVTRQIAAMIRLQLLTGCRPGEIVLMRGCDIDTTGDIWVYSPSKHKTSWRGHERNIYLGPKAQEIVREFTKPDAEAYLFSPRDAMAEYLAEKSRNRKTPLSYGNKPGSNRKRKPRKQPGEHYSPESYCRAIAKACRKAGIDTWSPNQLRHTAATEVRKAYGVEAAQVVLGHPLDD